MAEYSRNHSDKKHGGYKKNKDRNSSPSHRSDRSEQNKNRHTKRDADRPYNDKKKPFDKNRGGGKRFDDRKNTKETKNPSADYCPSKNAPEIDTDVTGKELENWTLRALRQLEAQNADTVAKHLVMVGRYLDIDPDFALQHALAASKRAGRIGVVREVVGIAAYAAENFELALRELRTHRRISGSNEHLALLVDCERALGRIEKALTLAQEAQNDEVPAAVRSEVALVVSGIYQDQGELKKAIKALEIPELNPKRGFEYSPRLFNTYAELLHKDGRGQEASRWARLAVITEAALGQGNFVEPEIFDIFTEEDLLEPAEEASVDLEAAEATEQSDQGAVTEAKAPEEATVHEMGEQDEVTQQAEKEAAEPVESSPAAKTVVNEEQATEEALFELAPEPAHDAQGE